MINFISLQYMVWGSQAICKEVEALNFMKIKILSTLYIRMTSKINKVTQTFCTAFLHFCL